MAKPKSLAPVNVESKIFEARGERLILDRDLAETYGVTTRALNQALKRNRDRFPDDSRFSSRSLKQRTFFVQDHNL